MWFACACQCVPPLLLADGDYLLPVYHETGFDTEVVGADSTSLFMRFNPKTKKWNTSAPIRSPKGNIQPSVVQLGDDYLVAYCRRGGRLWSRWLTTRWRRLRTAG